MARFVVLVIDSFGVGAMKDVTLVRPQDAGANTCGHILSQLPHLQLPTLEKLGLIKRIGLCARRYATVRFRNLGCGRAAT
ncbi:metalloenzyme superfamily protein [Escherichia coli]|uniref:Metalloenzyme superfamily protein n=1 Tax=Escherichia coli TaxID=562 RepID=A0A377C6F5_ECOLX|nr:metalloenzyme superfamily protein [Escherichia coli]